MIDARFASPRATAIRTVFTRKYTKAAATIDGITTSADAVSVLPPVQASTCAADSIDSDCALMVKAVRDQESGTFTLNVHWAHAPAMVTQTVAAGPRTSIEANDTAVPIEIDEDDSPIGSVIFIVWTALE